MVIHTALAARVHVNPRTTRFCELVALIEEGGRTFEGKADLMQRLMKLDEFMKHCSGSERGPAIEEHVKRSAHLFRRILDIPPLV